MKTKYIILVILAVITTTSYSQTKIDSVKNESVEFAKHSMEDFAVALSGLELQDFVEAGMPISSIFTGSDDVFNSSAGYVFGPVRFSNRGIKSKFTKNYIGGINVNSMEKGGGAWFMWSGLNDAVRNKEIQNGTQYNRYSFSDIGGSFNIETRASSYAKGIKATYSSANKSYTNRLMVIASTGIMNNGWAITFSGTRRWADEGYQNFLTKDINHTEGTFYDAWSYFLAIEKKINKNHSIAFTAVGAPSVRGGRRGMFQNAYDQRNNYYSACWGYQDGKKRNTKENTSFQPLFILNHFWDFSDKTQLKTSFAFLTGLYSKTAPNWRQSYDPKASYYRNWPYYYLEKNSHNMVVNKYKNDDKAGLFKWDRIINNNRYNPELVDSKGKRRSAVIIEGRNEYKTEFNFNSVLNTEINKFKINAGIEARIYKGNHYNTIEDLLGGDYWLDIDGFVERDYGSKSPKIQSDLDHPNRIVKEGDTYSHDYDANVNSGNIWIQTNYLHSNKLNFTFGLKGGITSLWRTGNMRKGLYEGTDVTSKGDSKKINFIDLGSKIGAYYKINGKHQFEFNASFMQNAPHFNEVFVSSRKHNGILETGTYNWINNTTKERFSTTVDTEVQESKTFSTDLSYHLSTENFKGRFTGYYTKSMDESEIRSMYLDGSSAFTNFIIDGIDKQYIGLELGLEYSLTSEIKINLIAAHGIHKYTNNPNLIIFNDAEFKPFRNEKTYLKDYKLSNGPQTAISLGFKYWSSSFWFIGTDLNYFANSYIGPSAIRRTVTSKDKFKKEADKYNEYIKQEKLDAGFTLNIFAGKSWRIDYKYFINLSLNVSNALNNQSLATGGYENTRVSNNTSRTDIFPTTYFYFQGLNYFLNLSFRF